MEKPTIKDSGTRRQFEGGAVRDRGEFKSRPDLISPHAQMREGAILAAGAEKYDPRNWERGMPLSECLASTMRHLMKYMLGMDDEDHLAMARTNLGFAIHFEEEIKAGRMDPKWDDLPKYTQRMGEHPQDPAHALKVLEQPALQDIDPTRPVRFSSRNAIHHEPGFNTVVHSAFNPNQSGCWYAAFDADAYHDGRDPWWRFECPYRYNPENIPATSEGSHCYIAGPMRGYEKFNFPTFDLARDLWAAKGWNVISPADLDRDHGISGDDELTEITEDLLRGVIKRDADAVLALSPGRGDCLVVLPGWGDSTGANAELGLARFMGLPVARAFDGEAVPE